MSVSFPGESAEYRAGRNRLLDQEVELRRMTEAVAATRRALPPGGVVAEDYVFEGQGPDGATAHVTLSELFAPETRTLFIYNLMFPRAVDEDLPCPSCTQFLDAFDGVVEHAGQRINVAVVAKTGLDRLLAHGQDRGWRRMRLLSSADNAYNRDYHGETDDGSQQLPMLNVFQRDGDTIRHFWGSELLFEEPDPGQDPRHGETIDPLWNLFDFTPEGRGTDWYPDLSYPGVALTGSHQRALSELGRRDDQSRGERSAVGPEGYENGSQEGGPMTDTPTTDGPDEDSDPGPSKTTVPGQSAGADARGEGDSEGGTLEDQA